MHNLNLRCFQVARVRLHGFSEREISIVRSLMMSEIESAYLERDQMQSTSLRDEYLQVCFECPLICYFITILCSFFPPLVLPVIAYPFL